MKKDFLKTKIKLISSLFLVSVVFLFTHCQNPNDAFLYKSVGFVERTINSTQHNDLDTVNVVLVLDNSNSMASRKDLFAQAVEDVVLSLEGYNVNFYVYTVDYLDNINNLTWEDPGNSNKKHSYPKPPKNIVRTISKDMTSEQVSIFAEELQAEINSIQIKVSLTREEGLAVSSLLLYDPTDSPVLDTSIPTAFVYLTDEDESYSSNRSKSKTILSSTPITKTWLRLKKIKIRLFNYENGEPVVANNIDVDVIDEDTNDLYNNAGSSSNPTECNEAVLQKIPSEDLPEYDECVYYGYTKNVLIDNEDYESCDATYAINEEYIIYEGAFHSCTQINSFDNEAEEDRLYQPAQEFKELALSKFGANNLMFYPIIYNENNNSCSEDEKENMEHASTYINLANELNELGVKTSIGDICADDYGPGVESMLNEFIYSVHSKIYEVGSVSSVYEVLNVKLQDNEGNTKKLYSSEFETFNANGKKYIRLDNNVELDLYTKVAIEYAN